VRTDPDPKPRIDHQDAGGFDPFGFRSHAAPRPRPQPLGGDR
jgi:hypothetical protein